MKIKLNFNENEKSLIVKSLTLLRNYLYTQSRSTTPVDEILLKMDNDYCLIVDEYENGIIINALNNFRYKLKSQNESRAEVNDVLLKIIDVSEKRNNFIKGYER